MLMLRILAVILRILTIALVILIILILLHELFLDDRSAPLELLSILSVIALCLIANVITLIPELRLLYQRKEYYAYVNVVFFVLYVFLFLCALCFIRHETNLPTIPSRIEMWHLVFFPVSVITVVVFNISMILEAFAGKIARANKRK